MLAKILDGRIAGPESCARAGPCDPADRKNAGYTLLELLVVMGILAVLTAVATPQLMGYFGKAKTQSVQLQIENIGTALELYYMENGAYPSASAGLKALVEPPPEAPRWNGPYLKKAKNLLDPWGRPYQYAYPASTASTRSIRSGRPARPIQRRQPRHRLPEVQEVSAMDR